MVQSIAYRPTTPPALFRTTLFMIITMVTRTQPNNFIPLRLNTLLAITSASFPFLNFHPTFATEPNPIKTTCTESAQSEDIPFGRIPMDRYSNFLKNWDDAKHPTLLALVRTPKEYDLLFGAAPVIGNRKEFAPPNDLYNREQLLIIGRVIPASNEPDKVLVVERLLAEGKQLVVQYKFQPPTQPASFQQKIWLTILLPKRDFDSILFVENKKEIGALKLNEGQWAIPTPEPEKQ